MYELRRRASTRVNFRTLHLFGTQLYIIEEEMVSGTNPPSDTADPSAVNGQEEDTTSVGPANLTEWAQSFSLTADTIKKLTDNGCDSVEIVTSLEEGDVAELGLNLGQHRMLLKAIRGSAGAGSRPTPSLGASGGESDGIFAVVPPPGAGGGETGGGAHRLLAPPGEDLPRPLAELLGEGQGHGSNNNNGGQQPPAITDPEIFLHLASQKGEAEYYDIVDFVPGEINKRESVIGSTREFELIARAVNSRQSKLFSVTPQQWSAANSAIMARLIQDGLLGGTGVNQYLNYSYKVSELGQMYTWQSVLQYDRQYRILQSRLSFAWGTDISHLRTTTLTPKPVQQSAVHGRGANNRGHGPRTGKGGGSEVAPAKKDNFNAQVNLCRDYNRGNCQRESCKFVHRCGVTGCFERHPASTHEAKVTAKN